MEEFKKGDEVSLIGFPEVRLVVLKNDNNGLSCRYWCSEGFKEIRLHVDEFQTYESQKRIVGTR